MPAITWWLIYVPTVIFVAAAIAAVFFAIKSGNNMRPSKRKFRMLQQIKQLDREVQLNRSLSKKRVNNIERSDLNRFQRMFRRKAKPLSPRAARKKQRTLEKLVMEAKLKNLPYEASHFESTARAGSVAPLERTEFLKSKKAEEKSFRKPIDKPEYSAINHSYIKTTSEAARRMFKEEFAAKQTEKGEEHAPKKHLNIYFKNKAVPAEKLDTKNEYMHYKLGAEIMEHILEYAPEDIFPITIEQDTENNQKDYKKLNYNKADLNKLVEAYKQKAAQLEKLREKAAEKESTSEITMGK